MSSAGVVEQSGTLTNRAKNEIEEMSSEITTIICAETGPHKSLFPSLDLSSRCSNLSWALSPKHVNKSA